MDLYGLLGKPLSHSYSKRYFEAKFERENIAARYELFPLDTIESLPELLLKHPELKGLNVTIPYKQQVIKYLDYIDHAAKMIGAVNTIAIQHKNGKKKLTGYNTDAPGFEKVLTDVLPKNCRIDALVLGTGGAAKAVRYVLRKKGIVYRLVSRKGLKVDQLTYSMITRSMIQKYKLIINTTPLGMYPNLDETPDIPYEYITKEHTLIDLIYNPEETKFLKSGREMQANTANGLSMFYNQAEEAWKIWNKNK